MPPSKVAVRVSVLAFGVGLGVAITTGSGVAAADDSASTDAPSKSTTGSSAHANKNPAATKPQSEPTAQVSPSPVKVDSSTQPRTRANDAAESVQASGSTSATKSRSRTTTAVTPAGAIAATAPPASTDNTVVQVTETPAAAQPSTALTVPAGAHTSASTAARPYPVTRTQGSPLRQFVVHAVATWLKPLVDNAPAPTPDNPIYAALLNFARRIVEDGGYGTQAGYSFKMVNNTSHTLKLVSLTDRKGLLQPIPTVGDTIAPGETMIMRPEQYTFYDNWSDATFQAVDNSAITYHVHALDPWDGGISSSCDSQGGTCSASGVNISLLDQAGTTYTIGPDQRARQTQLLQSFCVNGSGAKCTFTSTGTQQTYTPEKIVGPVVHNTSTDTEQSFTLSFKDTVTASDSVQIAFKAGTKIFDLVTAEISTQYQRTVTTSHEFSQSFTVKVPKEQYGWLSAQEPIFRDTGTFTIEYGNTKYILTGVYFDSPNPDGAPKVNINTNPTPPAASNL